MVRQLFEPFKEMGVPLASDIVRYDLWYIGWHVRICGGKDVVYVTKPARALAQY